MKTFKKIIISSGGTGGHVIPAINLGNFLIDKGYKCVLFIDKRGLKYSGLFRGEIYLINSSHMSGNLIYKIKSLFNLFIGFIKSLILLIKFRPNYFFSFGSYATLMPTSAILILKIFFKIDIFIHEQNSVIGRVNKLFLPFAKIFFSNFKTLKNLNTRYLKKKIHSGTPIYNQNKLIKNYDIKKIPGKIVIFIYGGSQGSIPLNNIFIKMLNKLDKGALDKIQIIIQSPKKMHIYLTNIFKDLNINYKVKEFYSNIEEILSFTDLAITRAGAGTINDLINYSVPSILIPLPNSANNHQFFNAKFIVDRNGAILLNEKNLDTNINSNIFMELINNQNKRGIMVVELKKIIIPNANEIILSNIYK